MKYLKIVLTMVLLVAFVFATADAAKAAKANDARSFRLSKQMNRKLTPAQLQELRQDMLQEKQVRDADQPVSPIVPTPELSRQAKATVALCGDILVGTGAPGGQPYPNIFLAVKDLKTLGVCPTGVRFLLTDPVYAETAAIVVTGVPGSGLGANIKFQPYAGNTSCLVKGPVTNTDNGFFVIKDMVDVTIEGTPDLGAPGTQALTIRYDETKPAPTAQFCGALRLIRDRNLTVQNTIVIGRYSGTAPTAKAYDAISTNSGTGGVNNANWTINNCILVRGRYGIDMASSSPFPLDSNIVISNNKIGSAFNSLAGVTPTGTFTDSLNNGAIITGDMKKSAIHHNTVDGINYSSKIAIEGGTSQRRLAGIFGTFTNTTDVYNNVINNVVYNRPDNPASGSGGGRTWGIHWSGNLATADPGGNRIYNNCITNVTSRRANTTLTFNVGPHGIIADFDRGSKIWHNSIWLTGTATDNSVCDGIDVVSGDATGAQANVQNNAIENTMAAGAALDVNLINFQDPTAAAAFAVENHNCWGPVPNGEFSYGYADLFAWNTAFGLGANDVEGNPGFTSTSNLHYSGVSYAYKLGASLGITNDIDDTPRGTPPSAGCDEASSGPNDIKALSIAAGYMFGTPEGTAVPVTIKAKNNGALAKVVTLNVTINSVPPYSKSVPVSFTGAGYQTTILSGVDAWAPVVTGSGQTYTLTAAFTKGDDATPSDDTVKTNEAVYPVKDGVKYTTSFESASERDGWFGTGDFEEGTPQKLGGAHTGSQAWATTLVGLPPGAASYLFTPYFDFTNNPHPKISLWQSLRTEPSWDASNLQYTTDLGTSWHIVGTLNSGQNWYSGVYQNAAGVAAATYNYQNPLPDNVWFPDPDNTAATGPKWTSNGDPLGDDVHTGPDGYVYVQHIADNLGGKSRVQFRYVANPDASGTDSGWVVDDFEIHPATAVSGVVWNDLNGDGFHQGTEPGISGVTVTAFGPDTTSAVTDGNGAYTLYLLNGTDSITVTSPVGGALTTAAYYNVPIIKNPPVPYNFNWGYYNPATVTGLVYNDVNHNSSHDLGEPGIANVTVNVTGPASASGTTNLSGNYNITVNVNGAGSYNVSEVVPAGYIAFNPGSGSYSGVGLNNGGTANRDFGDAAAAVGQSYRVASYEDWALAKDAALKYKSIKCKPNQVQFKFNLIVPQNTPGNSIVVAWKNAKARITKGKAKVDSVGNLALGSGGIVTFSPPLNPGDTIQFDGYQIPGKARVVIKYAWNATKAKNLVEVYKVNSPRLPMPNMHNIGEEIFSQILQPVYGSINKVRMVKYASVLKSFNASGTLHNANVTCLGLIKQTDAVKPDTKNNKLWAEWLTLEMNILASDFGKFPPGFGDLIYNDQNNLDDPFNGKSIRTILAQCDTFIACLDTPKGSDGNVYYNVLRRLNHDSFRDSTNFDTVSWSCQKIVINGARPLSEVDWLQANPNPVTVPIVSKPVDLYNLPTTYSLKQNYPNPFNPSTTIEFALPEDGIVTLKVYNVLGQEVATLFENATMDAGVYPVDFDASSMASGIYFYRLTVHATNDDGAVTGQAFSQVKKMLLMK